MVTTAALYEVLVTGLTTLVVRVPMQLWVAQPAFAIGMLVDGMHTYVMSEFEGVAPRWSVAKKVVTALCVATSLYDSRAIRVLMVYAGVVIIYLVVIVARALVRKPQPLVLLAVVSLYGLAASGLSSLASSLGLVAWPETFPQALANFSIVAASTLVVEFIGISRTNQLLSASLQVTNTDLASALSKAQESTRVKSELLASVSHELRTPLNAIVNIPEGLLEDFPVSRRCGLCNTELTQPGACLACGAQNAVDQVDYIGTPADTARYLKRVHGSGRHLLSVVNDILDFSRMNAGRFPLTLGTVEIGTLLETLNETAAPLALEKRITLTYSTVAPTDTLRGDAVRLRQVLLNLVGNAIKFSEAGGKVGVTVTDEGSHWCFAVKDEGIGIDEAHQRTIFESFRQVEGGSTRRFGGTGLGLSIARELVSLHEGTLTLQSQLGQGSTFTFRVPKEGPVARAAAVRASVNESRSILIVDDDPTMLETMKLALRPLGAVLVGTTDPRGALAMVRQLKPDLVIVDVMMPYINGLQLLRTLREGADTKHLPVLVTSAYHEHEPSALELGAQWMARPWDNAELTKLTASLLDDASQRPAGAHLAIQQ
jgi:signal transduction histidine kinase/ActR/RegA family two-component response regulator